MFSCAVRIAILAVVATFCVAPLAFAEDFTIDVSHCQGNMQTSLVQANLLPCRGLAEQSTLAAADRAAIYFQLAVSEFGLAAMGSSASGKQVALDDLSKSAELNPFNPEPAILIASNIQGINQSFAAKNLQDAMKRMPQNPLLEAALAYHGGSAVAESTQLELCNDALEKQPSEYRIQYWCAHVYQAQNLLPEANRLYQKMAKSYQLQHKYAYGLVQLGPPQLDAAVIEESLKHYSQAVDLIRQYGRMISPGSMPPPVERSLADDLLSAGQFRAAADEYGYLLLRGDGFDTDGLKVKLISSLLLAGQSDRAIQLIAPMLGRASEKPIIQFQLFLKERVAPELQLSGKFDEATSSAVMKCAATACKAVAKP